MNDNLFIIFEKIFILQKVESIVCEQIIATEYHDVYNVTREFLLKNSCLICHLCRNCQENALGRVNSGLIWQFRMIYTLEIKSLRLKRASYPEGVLKHL